MPKLGQTDAGQPELPPHLHECRPAILTEPFDLQDSISRSAYSFLTTFLSNLPVPVFGI
jgi:hypothetical protein